MTNYEIMMRYMTPEKLAGLIANGGSNICSFCIFQGNGKCDWYCSFRIEEWLEQEAEDEAN